MSLRIPLTLFGLLATALMIHAETISFKLFATDLNDCDPFNGPCDAYVKIFCQSKASDWKLCGQTETIDNDNFPIWEQAFHFDHFQSERERMQFQVLDSDYDSDDLIATVEIDVDSVLNETSIKKTYPIGLNGRGTLYIRFLEEDEA